MEADGHVGAPDDKEVGSAALELVPEQWGHHRFDEAVTAHQRGIVGAPAVVGSWARALEIEVFQDGAIVALDAAGCLEGEEFLAALGLLHGLPAGGGVDLAGGETDQDGDGEEGREVNRQDPAGEISCGLFHRAGILPRVRPAGAGNAFGPPGTCRSFQYFRNLQSRFAEA